jgi:hypothetical protein
MTEMFYKTIRVAFMHAEYGAMLTLTKGIVNKHMLTICSVLMWIAMTKNLADQMTSIHLSEPNPDPPNQSDPKWDHRPCGLNGAAHPEAKIASQVARHSLSGAKPRAPPKLPDDERVIP